jgi:LacI family transcriptional regulator
MPTIYDVAQKANVSISAVSLVVNNPNTPRVGATKRKLILETAAKMGYSASGIAKALTNRQTKILGLVVPMRDPIFFNHFIAQVLSGIQSVIIEHGYHLMIYSHQGATGQITSAELRQSRFVDGLIILNTRMCSKDDQLQTIKELKAAHIPFVMANSYSGGDPINYVGLDDYGTGELGGRFLLSRGHTRIALISGSKKSPLSENLLHGFQAALKRRKIRFDPSLHIFSEYDSAHIEAITRKWLKSRNPPTAIFCTDDAFVPEVYKVSGEMQLNIPGDIAVLGRGGTSLGTAIVPQLTTLSVPGFRLGSEAARILIESLKRSMTGVKKVILPCELIERISV